MNPGLELFLNAAGVLLWLTAFPALWMSGRIMRRIPIGRADWTRWFLWMALGGFFRIPLVDLLSALMNGIARMIPPDPTFGDPSIPGAGADIIVRLSIYAVGIYFAHRLMAGLGSRPARQLSLTSFERVWVILGLAGLFSNLIVDLVGNFVLLMLSEQGI